MQLWDRAQGFLERIQGNISVQLVVTTEEKGECYDGRSRFDLGVKLQSTWDAYERLHTVVPSRQTQNMVRITRGITVKCIDSGW
jgi:hypothetical protein